MRDVAVGHVSPPSKNATVMLANGDSFGCYKVESGPGLFTCVDDRAPYGAFGVNLPAAPSRSSSSPSASDQGTRAYGTTAEAAVRAVTGAVAGCFTFVGAAPYPDYKVAIFTPASNASADCGHQIANAEFFVEHTPQGWTVITSGGYISCPVPGVSNRAAYALGLPCTSGPTGG